MQNTYIKLCNLQNIAYSANVSVAGTWIFWASSKLYLQSVYVKQGSWWASSSTTAQFPWRFSSAFPHRIQQSPQARVLRLLKATIEPALHQRHKLFVAQSSIAIFIKHSENYVNQMVWKFLFCYGASNLNVIWNLVNSSVKSWTDWMKYLSHRMTIHTGWWISIVASDNDSDCATE